MTEKLYFEDQYIKDFSAEIINIIEKDSEFHIELDKTAFFPGVGKEPCDLGTIEDSLISYVYEKAGTIYHVSNKKPIKIHRVKCKINWELRFDVMQQNLGKHILSSAFLELFEANTVDFRLEQDHCTISIDKFLRQEELDQVELLANNYIFGSKSVTFLSPSKAELKKLSLKKAAANGDSENPRVVSIEDIDIALCSSLYPKSTLEVQFIRLRKGEKLKGSAMKVEFLCGKRAILDALNNYSFSSKICKNLNCNEETALSKIGTITSEYNDLLAENQKMKAQIADFQVQELLNNCDKLGEIRIVKAVFSQAEAKYVNMLSLKLTSQDNVVVLHALKTEGMATLLFMCSKNLKHLNMNDLLKDAISLIDGKGGGSVFSAQGGGKGVNNLDSALDYAFTKIKNSLV